MTTFFNNRRLCQLMALSWLNLPCALSGKADLGDPRRAFHRSRRGNSAVFRLLRIERRERSVIGRPAMRRVGWNTLPRLALTVRQWRITPPAFPLAAACMNILAPSQKLTGPFCEPAQQGRRNPDGFIPIGARSDDTVGSSTIDSHSLASGTGNLLDSIQLGPAGWTSAVSFVRWQVLPVSRLGSFFSGVSGTHRL